MGLVDIRADGSERVKYDYDGYFAYIRRSLLSSHPNYAADSHWHDDLEWISVLSGSMDYNVNGEIVRLDAGSGILVNARQMHYGFSRDHRDCDFICVLLHPMLLCTSQAIERDFVAPILSDASLPWVLLKEEVPWQRETLDCIWKMYEAQSSPAAPLRIQCEFLRLWLLLTENMRAGRSRPVESDRRLSVLKDMISFIQRSYDQPVSLSEIAASGNVSKSACLAIFKKYLKDTPVNYLIGCRLKRAADLLRATDLPVSEIALSVGFQGISHFTATFHKIYGCAPLAFRSNASS